MNATASGKGSCSLAVFQKACWSWQWQTHTYTVSSAVECSTSVSANCMLLVNATVSLQRHWSGWFRGGTRGNAVPIVKVFKNAQECNAAVKDKETFIAQSSTLVFTSLHFYLHFRQHSRKITGSLHLTIIHCECTTNRARHVLSDSVTQSDWVTVIVLLFETAHS